MPTYFARLALLVALLPLLVMGGALGWTYKSTSAQLRAERINQINDDIAALVEIYTDSGQAGLLKAVENRLKLTPKSRARAHYAVTQKTEKLAGDLSGAIIKGRDYTQFIDWQGAGDSPMIVRSTPLRGGEILHVARNDDIRQNLLAKMRKTFMGLALLTLMLGTGAGLYASRVFKRRIKSLNDTCAKVGNGHLEERAAFVDSHDEIGVLGGNVNDMLARISGLIKIRKNISDQVAHELRSPLTRLDAKLVEAAKTCDDPAALDKARDEISNCVTLLDSLLDVSALEAQSGDKTGFQSVNLSDLVHNMAEFYRGLAEDKGMVIMEEIDKDVMVDGDPVQLSRLTANLLENAIKYTLFGGEININLAPGPVLSVQDTGPGIPKALRESIFTPFFRAPELKKQENVNGHGLGLALCKAIAQRHDLNLIIEDAAPGARFVLKP